LIALPSYAGLFDDIVKGIGSVAPKAGPADSQIVDGLKEALKIGTDNAVSLVSLTDGYFGNQAIKILMPDKVRKVADVLGKVGYQQQVDEFVLSMNRAAEKAAPQAKSIFVGAATRRRPTSSRQRPAPICTSRSSLSFPRAWTKSVRRAATRR
jgi:hypothetical protein